MPEGNFFAQFIFIAISPVTLAKIHCAPMNSNIFFDLDGTLTLAVTYGFGNQKEIMDSASDYICHNPPEIRATLIQAEIISRKNCVN
jgi:hypothetical protein